MKSWRTTTLGIGAILFGLWLIHVTYVPYATLKFNMIYVWPSAWAMILSGVGLINARDHKYKDKND